ncbi:MAG: Rne/Rng family ribonuclease [Deltaproteobacteria bacterium]|nr:MAG: Rne/Rng family ribonuclease [Deltaproteobacteria bacterium]
MTEGEKKRRYWKRGGKKKKAGAVEAGAAPEGQEAAAGSDPAESGGSAEAVENAAPADAVAEAAEGAAAPKKGRRRGRRRGKKPPETAPGAPGAEVRQEEGAVEAAPELPVADIAKPFWEAVEPPPAGIFSGGTQEGAQPSADQGEQHPPGEGGRKRRRRRRRRRGGKGRAPGQAEAGSAPSDRPDDSGGEYESGDEAADHAAGLTDAEEPESNAGTDLEDEEEFETGTEEEGTGARKVMLIDGIHPEENRVAIVADGVLEYYEIENQRKKAFKGNIYKGKVVNIAPAIEAAFVEFGGGRHGFLPLNEYCAGALMDHLGTWNEGDKRPPLRSGMEILVQVTKEESTIKGAALTSYISIAGRYMVMMLGMKRYGISKKITGEKERERIRKQMEKLDYPDHLGFIVRTVGAARPLKDLKADLLNLLKLWDRTVEGARANKAPALLYEEQDIVIRTLRDNYSADVAEVLMNSDAAYRKASAFFDVYYPKQKGKLKIIRQKRPLYSRFNLEEQAERLSSRKIPLPSGGHIVIDRTEAIWTIDVNSGRSSKDRDIEDTAFRTNKEAAAEVTRQMRLRDIGGLIVVDFIDMESKGHNKDVEKILKDGLKKDKAKSDVTSLGKFGLVAISRQRMGTSFYDILLKGCETCGGTGVTPTQDSAVVRLFRRLHDELSKEGKEGARDVSVHVAPGLLETLLNQKRDEINRIERLCGGKVLFQADATLLPSTFAIGNGSGSGH